MKRFVCLALALIMMLATVACNIGDDVETTAVTTDTDTDAETTTVTEETTTTEEESTTEEEATTEFDGIEIDKEKTAVYKDFFVSFEYPEDWDLESYDGFGGEIAYGRNVTVNISPSESTGMFADLTQAMYDSVFVPMYAEMGIEIRNAKVSHRKNANGVDVTVIEQDAKMDMGITTVPFEWDMFVVTVEDYEVTVQIMKMAPTVGISQLIFDTLTVVYDGSVQLPDGDVPSSYEYFTEELYIQNGVSDLKGNAYKLEAQKLAPGENIATKFTVTEGQLASVRIDQSPSWNNNSGSLTLYVYQWIDGEGSNERAALKDGYEKTLASKPIAHKKFENYRDNAQLVLNLENYIAWEGGTYLVVLRNPSVRDDLGVGYLRSDYDARAYYGALVYGLPDDLFGYYPVCTTDVTAFSSTGMPSTTGYMNLSVEVLVPVY